MDRTQALLEGGLTQRMHATPHLQPYTVAAHSWGMAMLLRGLYPGQPSHNLLWAVLTHDVAERWTGDVPAPCKWDINPTLAADLHTTEQHINCALGISIELTDEEQRWLSALDLAELLCYCRREVAMGNGLVTPIVTKCLTILLQAPWVPPQVQEWLVTYGDRPVRTDDSFEMEKGYAKALHD